MPSQISAILFFDFQNKNDPRLHALFLVLMCVCVIYVMMAALGQTIDAFVAMQE